MKKLKVALLGILIIVLSFPQLTHAQDGTGDPPNPDFVTILATRSSPFDPPTEDVFVADDGPGLDTGCTFNTDFNHPLTIDIVVDQFVGAVDSNGFLLDPNPLIDQGIIPATIEVIMPAFDVDFNGSPPPERDEVLFNGQNLGLLNGDNQIWLLNSFTVDISNVKFPSASGNTATNQVQVNIDLLSSGRWCTAIDWVALVIPLGPKVALTITVMGSNKVREITDDVIYKQSFDSDCNMTTEIDSFDDFPFSGTSNKEVTLHTEIEFCPDIGDVPEVQATWAVNGPPPLQTQGTSAWVGLEGDVKLKMLDRVTVGSADIDYDIDGQTISVSRKVFVTKNDPLASISPPKKAWYEKAVSWGKGSGPGESDETKILENLLAGAYAFGNANWRYGYNFGGATKCIWQDLVDNPITCNYSDCYVFSDVFENMAAVLGIGGLSAVVVEGTNSKGFVTNGAPSIDPAFRGNSRPFAGGSFDRYLFSSHSLRLKGKYHDATFNGLYSSSTQFISWNLTGSRSLDLGGIYLTTDEGAKLYPLSGSAYDSWGASRYVPPSTLNANSSIEVVDPSGTETMSIQTPQFTGNNTFTEVDANGDGVFEALSVNVEVQPSALGEYTIFGVLQKGSTTVADRPAIESMLFTTATFVSSAATHNVDLTFSGEQIFRSGQDGPYELLLFSVGPNNESAEATFSTPAIDHTRYGEALAVLTGAIDSAVDSDNDGDFDLVKVTVDIKVRASGDFSLRGDLSKNNVSLVGANSAFNFGAGTHTVELEFPGTTLRQSGQDGPYSGIINLLDATGHTLQSFSFITQAYSSNTFNKFLKLDGSFNDQGIDINNNSLFDLLHVEFGTDVQTAGNYLVSGQLTGLGGGFVAFADSLMSLAAGQQTLTFDFLGPFIREQAIDGPYTVEVVIRDPVSFEEIDRLEVGTTQGFSYTDFDPFAVFDIELTGNSNDLGVDTNSNGLFDELHVEVGVALTTSDFYQWSARLVDVNGTEIDFDSRSGSLNAGLATINFIFDGAKIGENGINGPYFVKGLLMFGQTGPNVVLVDVAETQAYDATQFEGGVTPNEPPILIVPSNQNVQYSDPLSFTIAATDPNDPGETLQFSAIGLPADLTLTDNGDGTATVSGVAQAAPNIYTAQISVTDPGGLTDTRPVSIVVSKEDARATYTGPMLVSTPSISASTATVRLRATIQDITAVYPIADSDPGDITNATVSFVNRGNNAVICTANVVLLNPTDRTVGSAACDWNVNIGSSSGVDYTVGIVVDGYYTRNSTEDDTVVVVSKPVSNFIAGGGYFVNQSSGGTYAGDPELKTNFGLTIKFTKKLTNLQGRVTIIVRQDGRVYQMKTNALSSLVTIPYSLSNPRSGTAELIGKANVTDVTDPLNPIVLQGNATMNVVMKDNGEPGNTDLISISLWSRDGTLLFSSNWDAVHTVLQLLDGGNLSIK